MKNENNRRLERHGFLHPDESAMDADYRLLGNCRFFSRFLSALSLLLPSCPELGA